ncbi:MAG TPA: hypothetical protein P5298_08995 [Spirochaetia bacterium]|nr:hypothetical protein [Spirochaetaceae bacterium]HPE89796.1 hypothetical protein [Spirochaetales bacterium]HRW24535.1 hypothetical protein [Spirochaetia bacterium]
MRRVVRVARVAVVVAAAVASASSCGRGSASVPEPGLVASIKMARGNRLFADGYYHEAAALYLEAGAGSDPIASYDLANVFSALGEREAASSMRARAVALGEAAGDAGLKARAWFNDGVDAYAAGAFDEAAAAFRTALAEAASVGASGLGSGERLELSRAYELAVEAMARKSEASASERGAYEAAQVPGESRPLSLSRVDERTLFAPGSSEPGGAEDH